MIGSAEGPDGEVKLGSLEPVDWRRGIENLGIVRRCWESARSVGVRIVTRRMAWRGRGMMGVEMFGFTRCPRQELWVGGLRDRVHRRGLEAVVYWGRKFGSPDVRRNRDSRTRRCPAFAAASQPALAAGRLRRGRVARRATGGSALNVVACHDWNRKDMQCDCRERDKGTVCTKP